MCVYRLTNRNTSQRYKKNLSLFPTIALTALTGLASTATQAGISDRPIDLTAGTDNFSVVINTSKLLNVLANDGGSPNASTLTLLNSSSDNGGSLSIENGQIRYTPPTDFSGTDSFSYEVTEQDWRESARSISVSRSHSTPAGSRTGASPQEPIFDALQPTGDWPQPSTTAAISYLGIIIKPVANYQGCHTPEKPLITTSLTWQLTKTSGDSQGYAASINKTNNDPLAADSVTESNWGSNPQETRTLNYTLTDITPAEFDNLKLGIYTQYSVNDARHFWRSNDVDYTATVDTTGCTLSKITVQVNLTVGSDSDNDGVIDEKDRDDDNDGVPDDQEGDTRDDDDDGVVNSFDLDSDNDGISDLVEAGGTDQDGNGLVDSLVDSDGDGLHDAYATIPLPIPNNDNDSKPNYLDLDSDNDGIPDIIEAGGEDSDGDAKVDNFTDNNGNGLDDSHENGLALRPGDVDADDKPNYVDRDSDGDNFKDLVEGGGIDADNNGRVDSMADADGDFIPDSVDVDQTGGGDSDGDGIDDTADVDQTGGQDSDADGIDDTRDPDRDNNGIADEFTTSTGGTPLPLPDTDNDGIPDYLDPAGANPPPSEEDPTTVVKAGVNGVGGSSGVFLIAVLIALGLYRRQTKHSKQPYSQPLHVGPQH